MTYLGVSVRACVYVCCMYVCVCVCMYENVCVCLRFGARVNPRSPFYQMLKARGKLKSIQHVVNLKITSCDGIG